MKLKNAPWIEDKEITEILNKVQGRLVGGCVRDFILFGKLSEDIDIATPMSPMIMIEILKDKFKVIPTGLKHGTITVLSKDENRKYEITTLRKDMQTDGRHALVNFNATWEEDAARRDFTINALYCDINGNVYDYHNGIDDLENKQVKFIGDPEKRIEEDHLRIMRFFRFAARFGNYDKKSYADSIRLRSLLKKVSKERITQEWFNIIEGKYFFELFEEFKPLLEEIGLKNLVMKKSYEKLTALGKTFVFYDSNSMLLLSNSDKKYIKKLADEKLRTQEDALYLSDKYGVKFAQDKMQLSECFFELIEIPKFPITGNDLLKIGYLGKDLGETLLKLKIFWFEIKGELSKEDLLQKLKENKI